MIFYICLGWCVNSFYIQSLGEAEEMISGTWFMAKVISVNAEYHFYKPCLSAASHFQVRADPFSQHTRADKDSKQPWSSVSPSTQEGHRDDNGKPFSREELLHQLVCGGAHSEDRGCDRDSGIHVYHKRTQKRITHIHSCELALGGLLRQITGNATLHLYPHFRTLQEFEGVSDYLSTEISTSRQKKFSLVTFIDTPGLVDGDMKYPFDVNSALAWLGEQADLILVFFDPMGQALCKRTLDIVERLSETCGDRLLFYLSKADEAGRETDRQRVMMQIVQELCRRPGLNKCGFEMPTIYIPNPQKPSRCVNQIDGVCKTIEKTISQAVQKTLNQLDKDCDLICRTISDQITLDREYVGCNKSSYLQFLLFGTLGILLPVLLVISLLLNSFSRDEVEGAVGKSLASLLHLSTSLTMILWDWIPEDGQIWLLLILGATCYLFLSLAKYHASKTYQTLTKREKRCLAQYQDYIQDAVKHKKKLLYEEYLHQCAAEYDLG
ncbi:uncharacterized protein LOC131699027 isoform X2 [Acipenser ruthenus]|uniref:uncharacterized protein LOC131699027 isoform X2 n=1 Tax=Acipenser ruthenus TaxID=7906 RepID=UPI0027417475|nr:uncharacterized protein LOC131699027 isoform X2 [Acipenser ruthenus]